MSEQREWNEGTLGFSLWKIQGGVEFSVKKMISRRDLLIMGGDRERARQALHFYLDECLKELERSVLYAAPTPRPEDPNQGENT